MLMGKLGNRVQLAFGSERNGGLSDRLIKSSPSRLNWSQVTFPDLSIPCTLMSLR